MSFTTDFATIEKNLTLNGFSPMHTPVATTLNGTLNMSVTSDFVQSFTGTALGFSVVLPDATTLTRGWKFEIWNTSNVTITLKYFGGATFITMTPNSFHILTLQDASTTAGEWLRFTATAGGTATGIAHYNIVSSTPYTLSTGTNDVLITGMSLTPSSGEWAIWYDGSIQIVGNNTTVRTSIYAGATIITDSLRTIASSVSTFNTTHQTKTTWVFDGATTCEARVARSSNNLTVTGRSIILIRLGDAA
jgi:hypothetical protein